MATLTENKESGIGLYPSVYHASLVKGETRTFSVTVANYYDISMTLTIESAEFAQNPQTLQNSVIRTDRYSSWIAPTIHVLSPKSQTEVPVSISVPDDETVNKGSYYPAAVFSFQSTDPSQKSNVQFEHAIPIYVDMTETSVIQLDVTSFEIPQVSVGNNATVSISIQNAGSTYTKPDGYIEFEKLNVLDPSRSTRLETTVFNRKQVQLLPSSVLNEDITWNQNGFGHYQGSLYVFAQGEEQRINTVDFWIIPPGYLAIATAFFALFLVLITAKIVRNFRRRSRPLRK